MGINYLKINSERRLGCDSFVMFFLLLADWRSVSRFLTFKEAGFQLENCANIYYAFYNDSGSNTHCERQQPVFMFHSFVT